MFSNTKIVKLSPWIARSHATVYGLAWACPANPQAQRGKHSPLRKSLQETKFLWFPHLCEHHLKMFFTEQHQKGWKDWLSPILQTFKGEAASSAL